MSICSENINIMSENKANIIKVAVKKVLNNLFTFSLGILSSGLTSFANTLTVAL